MNNEIGKNLWIRQPLKRAEKARITQQGFSSSFAVITTMLYLHVLGWEGLGQECEEGGLDKGLSQGDGLCIPESITCDMIMMQPLHPYGTDSDG
ncbi:hypothetical protein ElyMa_001686600 [Elysia marginata]|uniref:Uncharacterized protein n=1 Tax=Elysia marginata TaxID=1093978 RepID=A0AAV4JSU3_9GAST|nr:hypothetical protein ElyMa_001686600 [Elysia marginata]